MAEVAGFFKEAWPRLGAAAAASAAFPELSPLLAVTAVLVLLRRGLLGSLPSSTSRVPHRPVWTGEAACGAGTVPASLRAMRAAVVDCLPGALELRGPAAWARTDTRHTLPRDRPGDFPQKGQATHGALDTTVRYRGAAGPPGDVFRAATATQTPISGTMV